MVEPAHPVLAAEKVRHVGDPVALVVAETRAQARDAADNLSVEYEPLPAVTDTAAAHEPGRPQVHDATTDNTCYDWEFGDKAATEAAFAGAAKTVPLDFVNQRLVPNAIEPRAAIGEYDPGDDRYTLWTTSPEPACDPPASCALRS